MALGLTAGYPLIPRAYRGRPHSDFEFRPHISVPSEQVSTKAFGFSISDLSFIAFGAGFNGALCFPSSDLYFQSWSLTTHSAPLALILDTLYHFFVDTYLHSRALGFPFSDLSTLELVFDLTVEFAPIFHESSWFSCHRSIYV